MQWPELTIVSIPYQSVYLVMRLCTQEWRCSIVHNKQYHSSCEQVSLKTSIFTCLHFWRLVSLCSNQWVKLAVLVMTLSESWQAKVRYFKVKVLIKEDILWFKISVCDSLFIEELDGIDELLDQCATDFRCETAFFRDEVKEFSFCELENNDCSIFKLEVFEFDISSGIRVYNADEILELKFFKKLNFSLKGLFLIDSLGVDLDSIELISFTSKIDTK